MKTSFLILSLGIASSQMLTAQMLVEDTAALGLLSGLLNMEAVRHKEEMAVREFQHIKAMKVQQLQHGQTLQQWALHFDKLRETWETLEKTRKIMNDQLGFIKQIQNAAGNPQELLNITFKKIDKEFFSKNGIADNLSAWLKQSKRLSDWGQVLERLFKPLDIKDLKGEKLRKYIRSEEYRLARLKRRLAIEEAYKEAEKLQSQARTLREKLTEFLQGMRAEVRASRTITGMQKIGLHLSVTEKGMRSAMSIGEDLAKRLRDLKTFADNRDAIANEMEMHVRNLEHNQAAAKVSSAAKKIYEDSRKRPEARLSASASIGSKGKMRARSSMSFKIPVK